MTHHIADQVVLPVVWNDGEHIWELDVGRVPSGPLKPAETILDQVELACRHDDLHLAQECDAIWECASATPLPTAEDLAYMLGSLLERPPVQVGTEPPAEQRSVSPALVDMLDGAIKAAVPMLEDSYVRGLIRALLPIIASVDENAHQRGKFVQRMSALGEGRP